MSAADDRLPARATSVLRSGSSPWSDDKSRFASGRCTLRPIVAA